MRIVICDQCGRALHETKKCYHCGSQSLSQAQIETRIPEDALETYEKMERLLAQRKFTEVISLSRSIRQWMSDSAEVYWMRLLAKMECTTDLELILHGADLDADEDYSNAAKYADPEAYRVYLDVQEKIDRMRMELNTAMRQHFRDRKKALELPKYQQTMAQETATLRSRMNERWLELAEKENRIRALDAEARLALEGYRGSIRRAEELANAASAEASRTKSCDEFQYQAMMIRLTGALQMSEEASYAIRQMQENHPWLQEYQRLSQECQQLRTALEEDRAALKKQNAEAQTLLNRLHELDLNQERKMQSLRSGSFGEARKILGEQWNQVLRSAEIVV